MIRTLVVRWATVVWLVLSGATALSWWVGADHGFGLGLRSATVVLMLIAFFKVRMILLEFMEVREAPWALRGVCEAWVVVVCVGVLGLYFFAPSS